MLKSYWLKCRRNIRLNSHPKLSWLITTKKKAIFISDLRKWNILKENHLMTV